jgi:hypothetical protein
MTKANFTNVSNEDDIKWKMTLNGRLAQISNVKYLSNYWSDLPQILKWGLYDQSKLLKCFKWRQHQIDDDLKMEDYLKYQKWNISTTTGLIFPNFRLSPKWPKQTLQIFKWKRTQMEDDLKWKTNSNIKNEISQQLLVGSSPNFTIRLTWPKQTLWMFQMKTTSNECGPQMLDCLKYQ